MHDLVLPERSKIRTSHAIHRQAIIQSLSESCSLKLTSLKRSILDVNPSFAFCPYWIAMTSLGLTVCQKLAS